MGVVQTAPLRSILHHPHLQLLPARGRREPVRVLNSFKPHMRVWRFLLHRRAPAGQRPACGSPAAFQAGSTRRFAVSCLSCQPSTPSGKPADAGITLPHQPLGSIPAAPALDVAENTMGLALSPPVSARRRDRRTGSRARAPGARPRPPASRPPRESRDDRQPEASAGKFDGLRRGRHVDQHRLVRPRHQGADRRRRPPPRRPSGSAWRVAMRRPRVEPLRLGHVDGGIGRGRGEAAEGGQRRRDPTDHASLTHRSVRRAGGVKLCCQWPPWLSEAATWIGLPSGLKAKLITGSRRSRCRRSG